eukprot:3022420-Amphidinium_carterae.1
MPAHPSCHPPAAVTGRPDERMGTFGSEMRADALALRGDLTCVACSDAWNSAVMTTPPSCHPPAAVTGPPVERMGTFGSE